MHHHDIDPATANRDRRAWLAAKLAMARANGERAGRIKAMRRAMWRLKAEAAQHGWEGDVVLPALSMVGRAARGLPTRESGAVDRLSARIGRKSDDRHPVHLALALAEQRPLNISTRVQKIRLNF